jgi:U3 small nucleolar RNA-associated protein 14
LYSTKFCLFIDLAQKEEERREMARIQERMTGRHSKKSKFATKDPNTRQGIQEKLNLREKLLKKMNNADSDEGEDENFMPISQVNKNI